MTDEIWRPIKGYEGIYEISSYWRVRSLDRYNAKGRFFKGKMLKVKKANLRELYDGLYVRLSKNGKSRDLNTRYIMIRTFKDCEDFKEIIARMPNDEE